ncbi:TatD family hydrolase [Terribacillus sp. DMT04]|uniref:TatD family hydrolase n=1 Tax=Terribacillus sp. DMT04 TaxID=2850441 RepID=UPI001C2C9767|nr:TatD family hydrolase [Terribacillus sp. DMT04]QXE01778.1 TatD family hydrolase [Terribacillus sp. DMT04]
MLFDTHAHINDKQFAEDREEMLQRALDAGVSRLVVIGCDAEGITSAIELAEKHDFVYAAIGWHPVDAIDMTDADLERVEELSTHPKVVAIGEMGLDYHWDKSPKGIQKDVLRRQIQLAKRVKLPIIIHNREATADIIPILREEGAAEVGGIMHCYSDEADLVQEFLDMNFYISLGGPVTFKNARAPKEVAKMVPADRLLIETDCPYLAPHPNRGKRNEPAYVKLVAEQIAELRGIGYEELAELTMRNAERLYQIKA